MDRIEKIGNSLIQHGQFNNRIYLLKFDQRDLAYLPNQLNELAHTNNYTKIIAKIPESAQPIFLMLGYTPEAHIPDFFDGNEDAFFMVKYFGPTRSIIPDNSLSALAYILNIPRSKSFQTLPEEFTLEETKLHHASEMAAVYRQVFKTYPFPIIDVSYLEETMIEGKVMYFGIWDKGKLVGISSAELDITNRNAEMTDFAVLPEYRGQKLASFLLQNMEEKMKDLKFKTLYTIARLNSPGMSKTFINLGYHYSGLLKNNTNISGQIESMNVFYKRI